MSRPCRLCSSRRDDRPSRPGPNARQKALSTQDSPLPATIWREDSFQARCRRASDHDNRSNRPRTPKMMNTQEKPRVIQFCAWSTVQNTMVNLTRACMKLFLLMISAALALSANEEFFEAARKGDVATLK